VAWFDLYLLASAMENRTRAYVMTIHQHISGRPTPGAVADSPWFCDLSTWASWACTCCGASFGSSRRKESVDGHAVSQVHHSVSSAAEDKEQRRRCLTESTTDGSTFTLDTTSVSDASSVCPAIALLSFRFPGYVWETLRTCRLRVDEDVGAGLLLQATRSGYLVDLVEQNPRQDSDLQPGTVLICIDACSLVGLGESELETSFSRCFCDGALLHMLDWYELCAAEIQSEACALGEWHEEEEDDVGAEAEDDDIVSMASPFLREQTGSAELLVRLSGEVPVDVRKKLGADLVTFDEACDPSLRCCFRGSAAIAIRGEAAGIRAALKKLEELVRYYGVSPIVEDELFIKMVRHDTRALLIEDLRIFGQRSSIVVELCCPPHEHDSILLIGDPTRMRETISEFEDILKFHCISSLPGNTARSHCHGACSVEDTLHEAEDLEVEGHAPL